MTLDHLDKIKERLAKITPGPWVIDHSYSTRITDIRSMNEEGPVVLEADLGRVRDEDAIFIAHAPTDIAALVEEIEKLKVENLRMGAITGSMNLYLEELKLENQKYKAALEKIADPRLRDHKEPDAYTELGCVMNIAQEALNEIPSKKETSRTNHY